MSNQDCAKYSHATTFEPAVTEDSDTALIIKELYKNKVVRSNGRSDQLCVGGAVCKYFEDDINWEFTPTGIRQGFPHSDTLARALEQIIDKYSPEFKDSWVLNDCKYYASALIEENDTGDFNKAWELVEEFCEEYSL